MLKGRLGLETARIPHVDRHGLVFLSRGRLYVEDGTLRFAAATGPDLDGGDYALPYQTVTLVLVGPGTTVSHDALRLLARHGTGLAAVGQDGVRFYTAPPLGPDDSRVARRQARMWADAEGGRLAVARRMYAWRLGEVLPHRDIAVLRGIEGARMKQTYRRVAERYGVDWSGRRYDRQNPGAADVPNQAINHAASAVEAAAHVAVAATAAIPQLGFIHEDSANSFVLDVADLFRDGVTLPIAFEAARDARRRPDWTVDRRVRWLAGRRFREARVIDAMIERIKALFDLDEATLAAAPSAARRRGRTAEETGGGPVGGGSVGGGSVGGGSVGGRTADAAGAEVPATEGADTEGADTEGTKTDAAGTDAAGTGAAGSGDAAGGRGGADGRGDRRRDPGRGDKGGDDAEGGDGDVPF